MLDIQSVEAEAKPARQGGAGAWTVTAKDTRYGKVKIRYRVIVRREPYAPIEHGGYFATAELAAAAAEAVRSTLTMRRRTIGDAIDAYKAELDARVKIGDLVPASARQIDQRLRALMSPVLDLPLAALTPRKADDLYAKIVHEGYRLNPEDDVTIPSTGTQHKILETARTWGSWCMEPKRGWFKASPWADVKKIGRRPDNRDHYLRTDEVLAWEDAAFKMADAGDEGAVQAMIALYCDLRPGEIVQLQARDVDDNCTLLHVDGEQVKTRNSRRRGAIPTQLRPYLIKQREGKAGSDLLFAHTNRDYPANSAKRICAAAGVPEIDARGLRHTYSTLRAERGDSLERIGSDMGHGKDQGRTAKKYYVAKDADKIGGSRRVEETLKRARAARSRSTK